jgi:hypothetical protein
MNFTPDGRYGTASSQLDRQIWPVAEQFGVLAGAPE